MVRLLLVTVLLFLLGFLSEGRLCAQSQNQNYVLSRTYKQSGADPNDVSKVEIQVQYFDGLGRSVQSVAVAQSPTGADAVQPVTYDGFGRPARQYLPYTAPGNAGNFRPAALAEQAGFYSSNVPNLHPADLARPYTDLNYEASPLDRPLGQTAPGGRSAASSLAYGNNAAGKVPRYRFAENANLLLTVVADGTYAAGTLTRTQSTDEQGHVTVAFTDRQGRQVATQTVAGPSETLTTYYVHDPLGRLRAVLQPQYQTQPAPADFAFLYRYDHRHRLTVRKVPGADSTLLAYDRFDRLALSQDGNQRSRSVWAFVKYDALNRPVLTGELPSNQTRAGWQSLLDAASGGHHEQPDGSATGYTLGQTLPSVTEANLLTISYYDGYAFPRPSGLDYTPTHYPAARAAVKNLPTGQRVRMLTASGSPGAWLASVTYYDGEYRPIQYVRQLPDLGAAATERTSLRYLHDLSATVAEQTTRQQTAAGTHTLARTTAHDHADRPLSVAETVTTPAQTLTATTAAHRYDELGQMAQKWLHSAEGTYFRRRTDYTHHLRGWLTDAQTRYKKQRSGPDLNFFAYQLAYDNGPTYTNGNISATEWRGKDEAAFTQGLGFTYDGANRLTGSSGLHGYGDTESNITFDKNGNILTLNRAGSAVDNLTYSYAGNRLASLNDASGNNSGVKGGGSTYAYDANGNMTTDGNRNAALTYNYLNLPKTVAIGGKTFTYDYDASGIKHKYAADTFIVKYEGPFEYDQGNALRRVAISEGQITFSDTTKFSYYIKDHLGNVRVVFDAKGKILQKSDYYPFGLSISRDSLPLGARMAANRYLYNEKELQVGSGYLDYGARMYMPEVGRWNGVDALASFDFDSSPYGYVYNNPLSFTDPFGMHPDSAANYAPGATVTNNTGSWEYLGDGNWRTLWEARGNNLTAYNPFLGGSSGSQTRVGPDNKGTYYAPFSWPDYLDGANSRSGLVAAVGSLVKTYPDHFRNAGRFTSTYWSKVRMLGKSYKVAQAIDKIANVKIKGIPGLGIVNAGVELVKLNNLSTVHASDIGAAAFNTTIGLLAFTNPVTATVLAIYVIADYSGALDTAKARTSQFIDNNFDESVQNLQK